MNLQGHKAKKLKFFKSKNLYLRMVHRSRLVNDHDLDHDPVTDFQKEINCYNRLWRIIAIMNMLMQLDQYYFRKHGPLYLIRL